MRTALKTAVGILMLAAAAAQAAPKAALFVQNRAGAKLEAQLDAFNDLLSTRLTDAGFEVVRYQDALDRFVESRRAEDAQALRQFTELLQTAKSEGTVDGPAPEASALRTAQLLEADFVVVASLVSLGENRTSVQAYGTTQEATTTTLRLALRVLAGIPARRSTATRSPSAKKSPATRSCRWTRATWSIRSSTAARPNWPRAWWTAARSSRRPCPLRPRWPA